ncbi:MAG: DUF3572 family protein [Pseudomonadota bacterium]
MDQQQAEILALNALAFLASEPFKWQAFLVQSGIDPTHVRAQVGDLDFLQGVLDFIASREDWVVAFADAARLAPETVNAARRSLAHAQDLD